MKVILTTDGSSNAEQAIRWFSRLPVCRESELNIVTVSGQAAVSIYAAELDEELGRREKQNADQAFKRACEILDAADCRAIHAPRIGHAADEIIRVARESSADLIVIGARGHSMLAKILLGSTSDAVATHASCSVLIVRHPDDLANDESPFHVTIAHDGSDQSNEALRQVARIDWPAQAEASLVTVIQHPALLDKDEPYDLYLTESMGKVLAEACEELAIHFASVNKHVLEEVHVGNAILNFAHEANSNVVVIGDTGQSAISRFFIGSVSRFVLHHADCSVLLVRKKATE
jgi:nucleotide-binding universal stress UspA family protein